MDQDPLLYRLNYDEYSCASLDARQHVGKQRVLSADDERFDSSLFSVVVDLHHATHDVGCVEEPI